MTLPAWWTDTDSAIARAFLDWYQSRRPDLDQRVGRCRQCDMWVSPDGEHGRCTIPATPSTANCGNTTAEQGCEQWYPRIELKEQR